jgi:RNA polymerase sigma factor (sigma-70 family)
MTQGHAGTILRHLRQLLPAEKDLTDAQLLQGFLSQRDEAAFAALMLRHGPMVLGLCRRILHNLHDAEDAFQATFLVLARMGGSIRKGEAVASWLHGVAYRTAMKSRTALARRQQHERRAAEMPRGEPSAELSLQDLQAVLDEEVNRLPQKYRAPFVLCCLESKSRLEVARELGWKEGTLASRLAHARKLLGDRLTRRGITLSAALSASALSLDATSAPVPWPLAATTIQAALAFASGKAVPTCSTPAAALAECVVQAMFLTRIKRVAALLLALVLVTAGAGVAATHALTVPQEEPVATAGGVVLPSAAAQLPARTDRYGDPLPTGAVARFGTLRLRQCRTAVFSPDGKHIVTGGGEAGSQVVFWDRQTGKEVRRLSAKAGILRLQFSPDGKRLAAMTGNVFSDPLWDVADGKILFTFQGEHGTFTSDGRHLLGVRNGSDGPVVGRWEVATGKQTGSWTLPAETRGRACSPDGKTVAYFLNDVLVLYDLEKKAEQRRWAGAKMRELTFSPDGKRLAASSMHGLRLWDVSSGQEEFAWTRLVDSEVIFSADGKRLAWTGYDERSIRYPWAVEIGQGQPRRLGLPINNLSGHLAFSPDGNTLAVITDAGAVELRDVATGKDALPLDANPGRIFGLELSADGRYLATYDNFRALVWDKATGKLLRRFPEEVPAGKPAEPPSMWDARLTADGQLQRGGGVRPNGHWIEVGPQALARLLKFALKDARGGEALADFQGTVQDVLESPDGRYLGVRLSAQPPGVIDRMAKVAIRVWDTKTGRPVDQVQPPEDHILGAFSPDNRILVTTSPKGTIHLWELASGQQRLSLHGHLPGAVRSILFTPDCRFLLSGGDDSQVLLWDLKG